MVLCLAFRDWWYGRTSTRGTGSIGVGGVVIVMEVGEDYGLEGGIFWM